MHKVANKTKDSKHTQVKKQWNSRFYYVSHSNLPIQVEISYTLPANNSDQHDILLECLQATVESISCKQAEKWQMFH